MTVSSDRQRRQFALPLAWIGAAFFVLLLNGRAPTNFPDGDHTRLTYYVVAQHHYVITLDMWWVLFGLVYFILEALPAVRYRRALGYAHLSFAILGTLIIIAPRLFLNMIALHTRYLDPVAAYALWNRIQTAGYMLTLLGLVVFVLLLADAVRLSVTKSAKA